MPWHGSGMGDVFPGAHDGAVAEPENLEALFTSEWGPLVYVQFVYVSSLS